MDNCGYSPEDLPHIVKPGKTIFNAETYVGNWYEDTVRNTIKRDEFLRKRECGDLLIQRTQTMVDLLLKPVELTPQSDLYLHYGDQVQIMSPGPSCKVSIEKYPFKRNYCKLAHLALSSVVPPTQIDHSPYLNTDSVISASPLLYPVVRNSFIIENPDCPTDVGGVVNYGDVFRIRAFDTQYFPLYLFSAPASRLHVASTHSARPKVRFSDLTTSDTLWTAYPLDAFELMKMEFGIPIPLKTRLLLKHNGSGNNLSIEPNFKVLTYFGDELEVTVDNKFDRVKRPTFENLWYFDTDRGWPKPKDPCYKKFEDQAKLSAKINANVINQSAAESAKEEAEAARGDDDDEEDENVDECGQPCPPPCPGMIPPTPYSLYETPDGSNNATVGDTSPEELFSQMSIVSDKDGLLPYDRRTAPQPNSHLYRVQDGGYPGFPNQKWNCGDTDCCNPRLPPLRPAPPCEKCECVETGPPPDNPNAPVPFHRLIM